MKKRGFTLSELIIALGIIAVAAALVGPVVTKIVPDKAKLKAVENYRTISDITNYMLESKNLYFVQYELNEDGRLVPNCEGLGCEGSLIDPAPEDVGIEGPTKFGRLFCKLYGAEDIGVGDNEVSMQARGASWTITRQELGRYRIEVDINGDNEGRNCSYSGDCVRNVDTFVYNIDKNGNVTPGDALTDSYLANPTNMHVKAEDYERAAEYLRNRTYLLPFGQS